MTYQVEKITPGRYAVRNPKTGSYVQSTSAYKGCVVMGSKAEAATFAKRLNTSGFDPADHPWGVK